MSLGMVARAQAIGPLVRRLTPSRLSSAAWLAHVYAFAAVHGDHAIPAEPIRFYLAGGPMGVLSNFARRPIFLDNAEWPSVEHYYQASKFLDPALREKVRAASTPCKAARLGRGHKQDVRSDWPAIKEHVMLDALRAKFRQHADLRQILLATGNSPLVEHTHLDLYWADGGDGRGLNRLGELLQQVRAELASGL